MKRIATTALLGIVLLAAGAYVVDLSSQRGRARGCPSLERLKAADATADAEAAHARGDNHLVMLGGYVGTVPGVSEDLVSLLPHVMLTETSDTTTEGCQELRSVAEGYASTYNMTIARLANSSSAKGR